MPLNLRLTAAELAQQLEDAHASAACSGARATRASTAIATSVPGLRVEIAPRPRVAAGARVTRAAMAAIDDAAPLAVLFTSGTSGRAEGRLPELGQLPRQRAAPPRSGSARRSRERWLACMPLFHVGGLSMLMRSVLFGGPVRLQSRFDARPVSDALDGGDIAGVSLVPTMLSRLLAHRAGRRAPAGLRVLLLGGAAAAPELLARALAAGYPVCPDLRPHGGDFAGRDRSAADRGRAARRESDAAGARYRAAHRDGRP